MDPEETTKATPTDAKDAKATEEGENDWFFDIIIMIASTRYYYSLEYESTSRPRDWQHRARARILPPCTV